MPRARSADLMDQVLTRLSTVGFPPDVRRGRHRRAPAPLDAEVLARLTLRDGAPLPGSLSRLFAYDVGWLGSTIDRRGGRMEGLSFAELLALEHAYLVEHFLAETQKLLPGVCYPVVLPERCHEGSLIFAYQSPGVRDVGSDELPVLLLDVQDSPILAVFAPTFAEYLALVTDVIDPDSVADENAATLRALLGKKRAKQVRDGVFDLPFGEG